VYIAAFAARPLLKSTGADGAALWSAKIHDIPGPFRSAFPFKATEEHAIMAPDSNSDCISASATVRPGTSSLCDTRFAKLALCGRSSNPCALVCRIGHRSSLPTGSPVTRKCRPWPTFLRTLSNDWSGDSAQQFAASYHDGWLICCERMVADVAMERRPNASPEAIHLLTATILSRAFLALSLADPRSSLRVPFADWAARAITVTIEGLVTRPQQPSWSLPFRSDTPPRM